MCASKNRAGAGEIDNPEGKRSVEQSEHKPMLTNTVKHTMSQEWFHSTVADITAAAEGDFLFDGIISPVLLFYKLSISCPSFKLKGFSVD